MRMYDEDPDDLEEVEYVDELPPGMRLFLDAIGLSPETHDECGEVKAERDAAIEAALHEHQEPCLEDDLLVSKWVAVVEYVDEDGVKRLLLHAPDHLYAWDMRGMLSSVLEAV